jgi:uncharacterized membrane protein (DUF2068 family)
LKAVKQKFGFHHYFGLRAVAVFEFIKGFAVLLIGLGLLSLVHKDVQETVENYMRSLHLDPAWHWAKFLVTKASGLNDVDLRRLAVLSFAYAAFRVVEAYGLWFEYLWAEWLAVISATIYLPWEIRHLFHKASTQGFAVLIGNLVIVAYLGYVLWDSHRARVAERLAAASGSQPTTSENPE